MRILVINQDWFVAEWRAAGCEVLLAGYGPESDVRLSEPLVPWQRLCGDFKPDAVMIHDNSSPILVSGLEGVQVPVLFYSVDAHHHAHYHRHIACGCDFTFVAQRDYLSQFEDLGNPVAWLPLWASRVAEPSDEKTMGAVFVGTMDPKLNPERVLFFDALKKLAPVTIERGEWWKIFPHAEIVLNQTVKGDLNFRVFEAIGSGSLLLTERTPNGFDELFTDGEHCITYERGNVEQAAGLITYYLRDSARCRSIAAAGRQEVLNRHCASHRAETVLNALRNAKKRDGNRRYFGWVANYSHLSASTETLDPGITIRALLSALRCAETALSRGEELHTDIATHLMLCATRYDLKVPGRQGASLLRQLLAKYPKQLPLAFGVMRDCLNNGEKDHALLIAKQIIPDNPQEAFDIAERMIEEMLMRAK